MTRQRKWQLKMKAQGRCIVCGLPSSTAVYCCYHAEKNRGYALARYYRHRNLKPKNLVSNPPMDAREEAHGLELAKKHGWCISETETENV